MQIIFFINTMYVHNFFGHGWNSLVILFLLSTWAISWIIIKVITLLTKSSLDSENPYMLANQNVRAFLVQNRFTRQNLRAYLMTRVESCCRKIRHFYVPKCILKLHVLNCVLLFICIEVSGKKLSICSF